MGFGNFINGASSFGIPLMGGNYSIPSRNAQVIIVDPRGLAPRGTSGTFFDTIQEALNSIGTGEGSTIFLFPATYEENIVVDVPYLTIVGAQFAGYARPDIVGAAAGGVPLTVNAQGFRAQRCRFVGGEADSVVQKGNGFSYEDCVFDGDLTALKCGLRLKPDDVDDSFTASEGTVLGSLFRGSAIGIGFDTAAPAVGVGSSDNLVQGNIFDRNTVDIAALDTGTGLYSCQFTKIIGNQFMDANKAVYIDMLTDAAGAPTQQSGIINLNDFATDGITTTNVKIAGTGFMFISNEDADGIFPGATLGGGVVQGAGPENVSLGFASAYAVIARASITDANPSIINGDVGLAPGTSQGIPPSEINGTSHVNDANVALAQADLQAAYLDAAGRTGGTVVSDVGNQTLAPGLYTSASSIGLTVGDLTLSGGPNDVWIFQAGTTFVQTTGFNMVLAGGARARNVFWQVGTSTTIGANCIAKGSFMSAVSSTIVSGAAVEGRVFAGSNGDVTGAVTVDANTISVPTL